MVVDASVLTETKPVEGGMDTGRRMLTGFDRDLARINETLARHVSSRVSLIEDIAEYSVLAEGKRLRPLLFVLSSRLCGVERDDLYRLSVIFEMIHTASLLHDDVLDNADFRRKKPSAGRVWGNHAAVLGGDFLNARSFGLALESGSFPFLEILSRTTTHMAEGQMLELAHMHDWSLSRDRYFEIITAKTAVLISATCACGAVIAKAAEQEVERLSRFGLNLGIAFQLIDDLLDYTSSEDVFGKPVGKDLREGKITLPLIRAVAGVDPSRVKAWESRFKSGKASEEDIESMIEQVRNHPALDEIRTEARTYVEKAAADLDFFPDSQTRRDLLALNRHLLTRSF
ncbi:MAG: polyprenyl synthetase family protein [Desulfobacteraceae bacterium]